MPGSTSLWLIVGLPIILIVFIPVILLWARSKRSAPRRGTQRSNSIPLETNGGRKPSRATSGSASNPETTSRPTSFRTPGSRKGPQTHGGRNVRDGSRGRTRGSPVEDPGEIQIVNNININRGRSNHHTNRDPDDNQRRPISPRRAREPLPRNSAVDLPANQPWMHQDQNGRWIPDEESWLQPVVPPSPRPRNERTLHDGEPPLMSPRIALESLPPNHPARMPENQPWTRQDRHGRWIPREEEYPRRDRLLSPRLQNVGSNFQWVDQVGNARRGSLHIPMENDYVEASPPPSPPRRSGRNVQGADQRENARRVSFDVPREEEYVQASPPPSPPRRSGRNVQRVDRVQNARRGSLHIPREEEYVQASPPPSPRRWSGRNVQREDQRANARRVSFDLPSEDEYFHPPSLRPHNERINIQRRDQMENAPRPRYETPRENERTNVQRVNQVENARRGSFNGRY